MLKNYFKRSLMVLGAAAVVASAGAQGAYRDVTGQYLLNPAYIPGWQGALTATADGVAETYNGAFNLYQTLADMPAGEYTLKVSAFYRCGNNDFSKANMTNGAHHYAYIYINGEKKAVAGLFDGKDTAPNNTGEANAAFEAGEYINEIKVKHEGGDMVVGIRNEGGFNDEWCCFDNFKLFNGTEDVTSKIKNADFAEGMNTKGPWNTVSSENKEKAADTNKGGGAYRKTNASPYNIGQQVELPAGKYRFGMLTFHRYGGAGNFNGKYIVCKGEWKFADAVSPKDWYDANDYDNNTDYAHGFIYMSKNETKPSNLDWSEDLGDLTEDVDVRTRVKDCWELCKGDYANMPDNETRANEAGEQIIPAEDTRNMVPGWCDSGSEREAAAAFVNTPEKYYQYVEFELTETTKVWLGHGKNSNTGDQYWHTWADVKLEKFDKALDGVEGIVADEDANAPVEYYNLQGVRVENPANGLYIVKQGNKVTKQVIRK